MAKRVKKSIEKRMNKRRKQADAVLEKGVFDGAEPEEYELAPRHFATGEEELEEGLPVRSADGSLKRVVRKKKVNREDDDEDDEDVEKPKVKHETEKELKDEYAGLTPTQVTIKAKEELASYAESLMEEPEENILLLRKVLRMVSSSNSIVSKLAMMSLVPIFKSIAPSYRIRALDSTEMEEKVSKDVQKLRFFEQNLVRYYKEYLGILGKRASIVSGSRDVSPLGMEMGILAARACCELAESLRFFNFRADFFKILVRRVMHRPEVDEEYDVFRRCVQTLEALLVEDAESGEVTFDIVRLLCKSIRRREFNVDESVVNVFLSVSLLSDYDPFAKENEEEEEKYKVKKKDRVFLTKKQRKHLKERKQIESELQKAELKVTAQQRERFQADALKMLLTLYLEILKARPDKLMAPVLEGLAKYGHQVNLDMMGDFLQVLREISETLLAQYEEEGIVTNGQLRQILLCVITSFSLVAHMPSKTVHLDLDKFVETLYAVLPALSQDADIEFSHKTLRLMDPLSTELNIKPSVNVSTEAELLLRSLNAIFFASRSGSNARALAFTKRLYQSMLHFPEKSAITCLKFVDKLMSRFDEVKCLYTTEDRVQNGVYHPEADSIEMANTEVAVLWENVLLSRHYNPTVSMAAKALLNRCKESR